MKKTIRIFNVLLILLCITTPLCYAFEVETHKAINEYVAQGTINGFSLNNCLKNNLGFQNGVKETFAFGESKMVFAWLGEGGKKEDVPELFRNKNHFHDPISNKGFGGLMGGLLFSGESSIVWSQKPVGSQEPGGYYSWVDTRDYFHKALTSTTKDERERYYAETFRGIGQLMHLVHDASVPSHTRNEFHAGYHYEGFVSYYQSQDKVEGSKYKGKFSSLLAGPVSFDQSLLNISSPLASIPFANIFDSETYTVTNTDPLLTLGNNIGLAEYTNANFFGDMTIFQGYPHPAKENTNAALREREAENGEIGSIYYIQGYQSDSLAAYSYFTNLDISGIPEGWKYNLDDAVYEDYAQKLIPSAVGYSAGLLDYFFRGKIDFAADSNTPGSYVIKNLGTENMEGVFSLYYDDVNGSRHAVPNAAWNIQLAANSQSSPLTFTPPTVPAPKNIGEYMLVFNGNMGQEQAAGISMGAVAGKHVPCTLKTDIIDYPQPLFNGNSSYESLPISWLSGTADGNFTLNGYLWIKKNPIPLPEWRCFWLPVLGCYWYAYYPPSPYANNYDPLGDRYTPQMTSSNEFIKVWIDLNGDKIFTDDELSYEGHFSPFLAGSAWDTDQLITIQEPLTIIPKGYCQTVMRMALRWGTPPSGPYDTWTHGDIQDFQVEFK